MSSFLNSLSRKASVRFNNNEVDTSDSNNGEISTIESFKQRASISLNRVSNINMGNFMNYNHTQENNENNNKGTQYNENNVSHPPLPSNLRPSNSLNQNQNKNINPNINPTRPISTRSSSMKPNSIKSNITNDNLSSRNTNTIPSRSTSKSSISTTPVNTTPTLAQTPLIKNVSVSNPKINHSLINNNKDLIKDPNLLREIENLRTSYRQQNFWKYHIIKLAPHEFYMTTNPDKRHRFIRNAPSYFIELELPNNENNDNKQKKGLNEFFKNQSQIDKGFRLVFTQQQVIGINGYDGTYKSFIIEKIPKEFGGNYKIYCQYNEFQQDWNIQNNVNQSNINKTRNLNFQFINSNNNNKIQDNNDKDKGKEKKDIKNNLYDVNNNLILIDDYRMGDFLHVCGIKDKKKSLFIKNKIDGVKLAKTNSVYFLDTGFFKKRKWFDPIIAVYRPCNRDTKNKLTKSVLINSKLNMNVSNNSKKLFSVNKLNVDFSNMNLKNNNGSQNNEDENDEDEDDEFDYDDEDDEELEDADLSENVIDSDNSKDSVNYSKFYNAKDGLFNRHPKDDSPNDYKIGWLTIYEKGRYFEKIPNAGNWQMVLGMTFAIGFEKFIDKYLKELNEVDKK